MEEEDYKAVTKALHYICTNLTSINQVMVILRSNGTIIQRQEEEIKAERFPYDCNKALVDCLLKRKGALAPFIAALEETKQYHIILEIEPDYVQPIKEGTSASVRVFQEIDLAKQFLKDSYLICFKTTNPFSLPFIFDIEKTWVSLAVKENRKPQATEDHTAILSRAFNNVKEIPRKMLIIEGNPATGKTCLMRRIAFDWAKEKMEHYDLVLYAEFRSIKDKKLNNIGEMIIEHLGKLSRNAKFHKEITGLINDPEFFEKHCVLILLDGYDESSPDEHCEELQNLLHSTDTVQPPCDLILTTRPGYLTIQKGYENRFVFAEVLGFTTQEQKSKYISNHFPPTEANFTENIAAVEKLLKFNNELNKIAEIPLLLTFICMLHSKIFERTKQKKENNILVELYSNIIWWLLDRYQRSHQEENVPNLFGYAKDDSKYLNDNKLLTIQDKYLQFPQLQLLGEMALQKVNQNNNVNFSKRTIHKLGIAKIVFKVGLLRKIQAYEIGSHKLVTNISFPHKTIQEFLAAYSFLFQHNTTFNTKLSETLGTKVRLPEASDEKFGRTSFMNEFEKFIWRFVAADNIAFSQRLEFFSNYTELDLDLDIFLSSNGISIRNLNFCLKKCSNVKGVSMYSNSSAQSLTLIESIDLSNMKQLVRFDFGRSKNKKKIRLQHNVPKKGNALRQTKSFVLLPRNAIHLCLRHMSYQSAELFCASIEHFAKVLQPGSKLEIGHSIVHSMVDERSRFRVDLDMNEPERDLQILSTQSTPKIFADQKLNTALQFARNATRLRIFEERSDFSFDLEGFTRLSYLLLVNCVFSANSQIILINLPALSTLGLLSCKIAVAEWQSFTEEISRSTVSCLLLSLHFFNREDIKEFLVYIRSCKNIKSLQIECDFIELLDNEFTELLRNLLSSISQLEQIEILNACQSLKECIKKPMFAGDEKKRIFNFLEYPIMIIVR